jgi:hypothetical protein
MQCVHSRRLTLVAEYAMPGSDLKRCVAAILADDALDRAAKIASLRQLEADALARQRGGTEGMEPVRPDDGEDLKTVERALMSLGARAVDQGPASL